MGDLTGSEICAKMRYFPDTNFFLQCKDAKELSWSDLTPEAEVELYIARTVQQEIDRHKGGGNSRRADRARRISGLLRSVLENPDGVLVLRESKPRVVMMLAPRLDPGRSKNPLLDLSQPDDRIAEEALCFQNRHPDTPVTLLTHDVPAMVTARDVGLPYTPIPDTWLLPPEPTAEAKQIAELQRRIATLEKSKPVLSVHAKDPSGAPIERLDIEVTQYEALTAGELVTIKAELDRLHPRRRDFLEPEASKSRKGDGGAYQGMFGRVAWSPPSDIDVSHYNTRHDRWRDGIEKSLRSYHTYLNNKEAKPHVRFELVNSGSTPADDLAISFACKSGLYLDLVREFREENNGGLTSPPKPPAGVYAPVGGMGASIFDAVRSIGNSDAFQGSGLPAIPLYKSLAGSTTRDPYGFYYHPRHDDPSDEWELRCEQFRHQLDPENFDWRVLMESDGSEMVRGVIRVRVSAANIPSPVTLNVPVHIRRRRVSTLDEAMAAIDPTVLAMRSPPRERFRNPLLGQ